MQGASAVLSQCQAMANRAIVAGNLTHLPRPTALQELSTIMRYDLNPIIMLMNNGAYTIEVEVRVLGGLWVGGGVGGRSPSAGRPWNG